MSTAATSGLQQAIYRALNHLTPHGSRREFLQAMTAVGISTLAAESLFASFQDGVPSSKPPVLFEGSAGALVLEQLKAFGLKYIFHTNTSGLSTILDAIEGSGVDVIMVPHEGLAVSVVEGYALAGGPAPFFMGSKVGVGHTISNLYNAWKDRTPMLIGFAAPSTRGAAGQDGWQEWDEHLNPTAPFTAWHWTCTSSQTMPEVVRRAYRFAHAPPGAPVTLDFPPDLMAQRVSAPVYPLDPRAARPLFRTTASDVEQAARRLVEARNPLLLVGPEVSRGGAQRSVIALAEKLGIPVCQSDNLFCDFPTTHPLYLGGFDTHQRQFDMRMRYPEQVDLIVNLGAKMGPVDHVHLVHVTTDASSLGRNSEVDLPILADVGTFVPDLSDALDSLMTSDRMQRMRSERTDATRAFTHSRSVARNQALQGEFENAPLSWLRLGYELEQALDRDAVIVSELGPNVENKILGQLSFGIDDKLKIGRTTGGALGWGLGAAFGVQLALPKRQVVAVLGDGGILFGQTEVLWSISRYDAPVLVVVMNNYSYNETRMQALNTGGPQFQSGHELTSYLGDPNVDFSKIASGYAIQGEKVRTPGALKAAIQRALNALKDGRPYLLDVEVERDAIDGDKAWHSNLSIAQLGMRRTRSSWEK